MSSRVPEDPKEALWAAGNGVEGAGTLLGRGGAFLVSIWTDTHVLGAPWPCPRVSGLREAAGSLGRTDSWQQPGTSGAAGSADASMGKEALYTHGPAIRPGTALLRSPTLPGSPVQDPHAGDPAVGVSLLPDGLPRKAPGPPLCSRVMVICSTKPPCVPPPSPVSQRVQRSAVPGLFPRPLGPAA